MNGFSVPALSRRGHKTHNAPACRRPNRTPAGSQAPSWPLWRVGLSPIGDSTHAGPTGHAGWQLDRRQGIRTKKNQLVLQTLSRWAKKAEGPPLRSGPITPDGAPDALRPESLRGTDGPSIPTVSNADPRIQQGARETLNEQKPRVSRWATLPTSSSTRPTKPGFFVDKGAPCLPAVSILPPKGENLITRRKKKPT